MKKNKYEVGLHVDNLPGPTNLCITPKSLIVAVLTATALDPSPVSLQKLMRSCHRKQSYNKTIYYDNNNDNNKYNKIIIIIIKVLQVEVQTANCFKNILTEHLSKQKQLKIP